MRRLPVVPLTCLFLLACGDNRGEGTSTAADEIGTDSLDTNSEQATEAGETNGTEVGETNGTTSNPDDTTNDGTSNDGNDEEAPKFDTLVVPDAGMGNCEGMGMGDPEWSYIWVANSGEGTISKINTVTLVEEGRYRTRADAGGSPSRTSVNLTGDVAVANRTGSVTKVVALHENCDEMKNGQPGLQTSSGKFDVLAWDQDDCVAWNTPFPGVTTQRPLAWTSGLLDPNTCEVTDQFVWTTAGISGQAGSTHVYRLNGDDGSIDEDIPIPEIGAGFFGGYGGAVDSMNNYWFITYDTQQLIKVDYETLDYTIYPVGVQCPYGFTIDSLDRPWTGEFCGGSGFFDPMTEQWTTLPGITGYGLQEDDEGVMWIATFSPPGLRGFDIETLQEIKWIMLPTNSSRGVSVDFEGYVWFVDMETSAWKVDTDAGTWESYSGLTGPYTYSDMTGHGLNLVSGGIPQG
ncbi:hypothetical protein ACNOYE_23990 [Nannocystaceae bacterium ST9]